MTDSISIDATNDPQRRSWVTSANCVKGDFPIQNLPFAVFRLRRSGAAFRAGVAIGDQIVDLATLSEAGIFSGDAAVAVHAGRESSRRGEAGTHQRDDHCGPYRTSLRPKH